MVVNSGRVFLVVSGLHVRLTTYVYTAEPYCPARRAYLRYPLCFDGSRSGIKCGKPKFASLAADPSESANNPRAQNYLGMLFYEGRGVTRDLAEAVKWFRRGARQSNAQACQNLGICYQAGLGVAKDIPKAVILFRQAVERGRYGCGSILWLP